MDFIDKAKRKLIILVAWFVGWSFAFIALLELIGLDIKKAWPVVCWVCVAIALACTFLPKKYWKKLWEKIKEGVKSLWEKKPSKDSLNEGGMGSSAKADLDDNE